MSKDTIKKWIIPYLSTGKRGFKTKYDLSLIFMLIVKQLKTGYQWRELPTEAYFKKQKISKRFIITLINGVKMMILTSFSSAKPRVKGFGLIYCSKIIEN